MAIASSSSPNSASPESPVPAREAGAARSLAGLRSAAACGAAMAILSLAGMAHAASLASLRAFADGLERQGAHTQAALEYRRLLFFSDTREDSLAARWGIWRNLQASGSQREAYAQARNLLAQESDPGRRSTLEWESLGSLARMGETDQARERAYALLDSAAGSDSAAILRFLVALEIAESQPEAAIRWADRLAEICPASAPALRDSLPKLMGKGPPKSALLAKVLSALVPGSGQLYAGEAGGAANSLILNALTGYGLVHGFDLGRPAEIFLYLALFQRFYLGGLKVAGARAEDANLAAAKADRLRALAWAASACPDPRRILGPERKAMIDR